MEETPVRSLQFVDLVNAVNRPIDGLASVREAASTDCPHERAVLIQAAAFEHVDYVYFRRFNDGRSSQVAAFVVDNSQQRLSEGDLAQLHHQLWLHGVAPLVYVAWPTRVDILSCARKPDFWTKQGTVEYKPAECIDVPGDSPRSSLKTAANISDALTQQRRRFSAYRLADGTFWDDPENRRLAKDDAAAHKSLIQAIVEADNDLKGAKHPVRRRLLVLMVLIKYLEDRSVFPAGLFGRFHSGARSFRDVLQAR